ncbi:hypothetical protein HPB51_007139 [Rhipicephalus microplus]|uniref:DUF2428 domain-containing protein n=1 Tax=Rhipicephalus microplus TaxID=6941 RepID=A0A9J6E010_RHIMP|nr:hypothetical protein HPB51_007139 [Rhipicephalus microplus]
MRIPFLTCQRDGTADPLITEILHPLVGLVHDDSISRYHSVSTLHLWFKTLEQLLGKSESEEDGEAFPVGSLGKSLFTPESNATSLVLSAVDANWESSANGVSDLIRKIYQSFLNVTHSQCSIENSSVKLEVELAHIGPFHKYLLERTMQLDWKEKPKYLSLACLLQFVPFESEPLMAKCLVHQSNAIRIETFTLCCSSYILNAGKPEAEMSKIVQFVMANLNVDDSWFRSRLLVQLENVLLALRESIVSEFNKETRQKKRGSRKSAGQSHYTSAFLFESGSSLQDVLQDTADKYLASPRPQDNAVGALLLHLYLTNLKEEPKQLAAKLEEICSLGLLLTLVTCLSDVKCILAAVQRCSADGKNRDLICGILTRALCLARSSLFHSLFVMVPKEKQRALGAMSANSADRVAPSFEDTNLAFTELIRDHEMAERIRFTPEQRQQVEERLASFCWHCIKNSCSLLDLVVSISLKDNGMSYSLDGRSLHDIVDALVAVMTGCRHRGAIESCCESLKSLCQVLSSCETTEISDIPFNFVKKRSMSWTVDHLSSVIRECAEQGDSSACTVDLPQAEALHILCAVVGSASLTAAVMMHLGRILWFCFEGLASPFWLVRNAAHQLYETDGNRAASQSFGVPETCVRDRRKQKQKIVDSKASRKGFSGPQQGRFPQIKELLGEHVLEQRAAQRSVTTELL